jgi:putative sporulation protein YtaF
MWQMASILWLALAVSLDGFGAGVTYGIRKMRIPFLSTVIIAGCSGLAVYLSMAIGGFLEDWLEPELAKRFGALIFIALGVWALFQTGESSKEKPDPQSHRTGSPAPSRVWTFRIRSLGLVIQILKTPMAADLDGSGSISGKEAFFLGIALALDSVGAGIGAAFVGLEPAPVALVITGMSALFLKLGMKWGFHFSRSEWNRGMKYLPGMIMVCLGLLRLF